MSLPEPPEITKGQIALDPVNGIVYYRDDNDNLVATTWSWLRNDLSSITTDDNVTISGNLTVAGTTVSVNSETVTIADNILILNSNVTSTPTENAGIEVERGTSPNVSIRWNESTDAWEYTNDGTNYLSIGSGGGGGSVNNLDDIGNVSVTSAVSGEYLKFNGTNWVNSEILLGTNTSGSYVQSLVAGTGVTLSNNSGEGSQPTVAIGQDVSASATPNFARVIAPLTGNVTGNVIGNLTGDVTGNVTGTVSSISNHSIDNLSDVAISGAANGDFLRYNGSNWINDPVNLSTDTVGDYVSKLAAGTGVTITNNSGEGATPNIAIGQAVGTTDTVTFNVVNADLVGDVTGTVSDISNHAINDLSDVVISDPANGDFLRYQSGNWINDPVNLSTDTVGDYVKNLVAGTNIIITNNSGEGATPNISVSGNTTNIDSISSPDFIQFDTTYTPVSQSIGKLQWDPDWGTLQFGLANGNINLQIGQEQVAYVFNAEATTLQKGEVVYIFGAHGGQISVKRASNSTETTSTKTFGVVAEPITSSGTGYICTFGMIDGLNMSAYQPGDVLWLGNTPGTFTKTKPTAPNHLVFIGVVVRNNSGSGEIFVKPQNGYELDELHNVSAATPNTGDVLTYNGSLWAPVAPNTDHGSMTGLSDDDHTQYLNTTRHDTHDHSSAMSSVVLDDISNVDASAPSNNQVLTWNTAGSKWVAQTLSIANSLDDLTDVVISPATPDQVLSWNGTNWVNTSVGLYWNKVNGNSNYGFGTNVLISANSNSYYNVGIGEGSLFSLTEGDNNISIGFNSLYSITEGDENIAIGKSALRNTVSSYNIAIGSGALFSHNGVAGANVAIGHQSLLSTTSGSYNTAVGGNSLRANTTGTGHSAMGFNALYSNTTGVSNVAVGQIASEYNTEGSYNVAIGSGALRNNIIGSSNVAIGYGAGLNETGSNKLYIANTPTDNPLIYGEFNNSLLRVNGALEVTSSISLTGPSGIIFEGATPNTHETTLNVVEPTADRTILLPNSSGTLALEDNSAWTSYTPTLRTESGSISLGNGESIGAYKVVGKTCHFRAKFNIGSSTTFGSNGIIIGLPVAAKSADYVFSAVALDNGNAWYELTANGIYLGLTSETALLAKTTGTGSSSEVVSAIFPFSFGGGDSIAFSGTYEIA